MITIFCLSKSNLNQDLKLVSVFQQSYLKNTLIQRRLFCPLKLAENKYTEMISIFRSSIFMLKKVRQNYINFSLIKIALNKVPQNMEL